MTLLHVTGMRIDSSRAKMGSWDLNNTEEWGKGTQDGACWDLTFSFLL